jgi:hypothetical protein
MPGAALVSSINRQVATQLLNYFPETQTTSPAGIALAPGVVSAYGGGAVTPSIGLDSATEFTLCAAFWKDEDDPAESWQNFRLDLQYTLDIFASTATTLTFGADWAGAWTGAFQQTVNIRAGLVVIMSTVTATGARFFFNGTFVGTKAGSPFTITSGVTNVYKRSPSSATPQPRILLHASWKRALSDIEALSISRNPWCLYAPRRVVIPTVSAAIIKPTLTAAFANSITTSTAVPQVTFTRP